MVDDESKEVYGGNKTGRRGLMKGECEEGDGGRGGWCKMRHKRK